MFGLCIFIVYTDLYQTFGENIDLALVNHFLCFEFCNLTDLYQTFGENIDLALVNLFLCFEFYNLTCVMLSYTIAV